MAVTFQPNDANSIVIGGEINPSSGLAGPFPRYAITREPIQKDTLYLGDKYSITITGTALITAAADMTTLGARQNEIHNIIKEILFLQGKKGVLEIAPYGGLAKILSFSDAVLLSAEAAEQDETSQGVQSQEYVFSFEAYTLSVDSEVSGESEVSYDLDEVSESWEVSRNEGDFEQDSATEDSYRGWTITHTITATGRPQIDGTTTKASYLAAKSWVDDRITTLGDDPLTTAPTDLSRGAAQTVTLDVPAGYSVYNQVNQISQDILEGTYSVTRTWAAGKFDAKCSMSFVYGDDQTAEYPTVEVSINVEGKETSGSSTATSTKYANAKTFFDNNIEPNIYTLANTFYKGRTVPSNNLNTNPLSSSQTHNQTDGVIDYSSTFNSYSPNFTGAISESLQISYINEDALDKITAILPVIGKADGPIIQDMGTTKEKRRSVQLDLQMDRDNRSSKPDGFSYIETNYKPIATNVYRDSKTENWNPFSGNYSLSIEYVWIS